MTIQSGFFNSINGDRRYDARWFADYFATFIGNGVFPNPSTGMKVVESENMNIVVKAGKGWINGYFVVNDSDYTLTLDNADGVLKRIDRVVMRLNYLTRQIEIAVKKGTSASNPVAPTLQRDTDAYELALADVLINNGATQITPSAITDTRLSNELCGIVHGVVDQVSTETLYQQYLDFWNEWRTEQVSEFEQFQTDAQTGFDTQIQTNQATFDNQTVTNQQEFDDWLASIQGILSGDVAGNLANLIASLDDRLTTHLAQNNMSAHTINNIFGLQETLDKKVEYNNMILSVVVDYETTTDLSSIVIENLKDYLHLLITFDIPGVSGTVENGQLRFKKDDDSLPRYSYSLNFNTAYTSNNDNIPLNGFMHNNSLNSNLFIEFFNTDELPGVYTIKQVAQGSALFINGFFSVQQGPFDKVELYLPTSANKTLKAGSKVKVYGIKR